jgi:hypothetical protein
MRNPKTTTVKEGGSRERGVSQVTPRRTGRNNRIKQR